MAFTPRKTGTWQKWPNFDFFEPHNQHRGPVFSSTGGEALCLSQESAPGPWCSLRGTRGDRCGSGKLDEDRSPQLGTRWPPGQAAGWRPRTGTLGKVFSAAAISHPIRCLRTSAQWAAARVQPGDIFASAVNFQSYSSKGGRSAELALGTRVLIAHTWGLPKVPTCSCSSREGALGGILPPGAPQAGGELQQVVSSPPQSCVPRSSCPSRCRHPRDYLGPCSQSKSSPLPAASLPLPRGTRGTKLILEAIVHPEIERKSLSTFSVKK